MSADNKHSTKNKKKIYTVYKHTVPNGKLYIGITSQKPEERWRNGNGYRRNKDFYPDIVKYGWENIKHEIVCDHLEDWQAGKTERKLIEYFDTRNPDKGYNHSIGGTYGALGAQFSAETRRKLSEARKGANNPRYGKHLTAELRQKISEANKRAYILNPELRRKLSEMHRGANNYNYGKHPSAETRRKLSEALKGRTSSWKGKHHSAETRRKISESHKGKTAKAVICVETGTLYISCTEAAKSIGVTQEAISSAVRGISKTSGSYHWKYAENMEETK